MIEVLPPQSHEAVVDASTTATACDSPRPAVATNYKRGSDGNSDIIEECGEGTGCAPPVGSIATYQTLSKGVRGRRVCCFHPAPHSPRHVSLTYSCRWQGCCSSRLRALAPRSAVPTASRQQSCVVAWPTTTSATALRRSSKPNLIAGVPPPHCCYARPSQAFQMASSCLQVSVAWRGGMQGVLW